MMKDLLVIETAGVLAGPATGMFFAELGARVVKLENAKTGGDVTRKWKLPQEDPASPVSAYFSSVNFGKEHRLVDLTSSGGRAELDELVARADVLITNHLEADDEKLGLQRDRLRGLNPQLIHGHIRGYVTDPRRPAFDVVLQAEAGFISMTGTSRENLAKMPVAMIDVLAAHQLKEGLLVALLQRTRTGQGAYVEVALQEAALTGLVNQASNFLMTGAVAAPIGTLHPNIAPYGELFTCADGGRIVLAVGDNNQFKHLCRVLGIEHISSDQHFNSNAKRVGNRSVLGQLLAPAVAAKNRDALLEELITAQVPAGAVRSIDHALTDPVAVAMTLESTIDGVATRRIRGNAFRITDH